MYSNIFLIPCCLVSNLNTSSIKTACGSLCYGLTSPEFKIIIMKFRDLSINNNKLLAPFYSIIPVDIELKPLIDEEALNTRLLSRNQTKDSQEKVLATI